MDPQVEIPAELEAIEKDEAVCIVYACESGSRAWGFASQDSDYDVRFLYVHPTEWYLSIAPGRDVIERPVEGTLDVSGWDLRKALRLFQKSNPPLLEWLQSPIVYRERGDVLGRVRARMPEYYDSAASHYHYLHMAQGNYRDYLQGDIVWLKKYLYVLRPLLACLWIERGYGVVPIVFQTLVERVVADRAVRAAVEDLIRRKQAGAELDRAPRIPVLSDFLTRELDRLSQAQAPPPRRGSADDLDRLFRQCLIDIYGSGIRVDLPPRSPG